MCRTVPLVLLLPMILCERAPGETPRPILLKAARVFDGAELATHDDWVVLVRGERIESVGPGAEEASGNGLIRVVRDQIGHGADWIKIYADTPWGPTGKAQPTFSISEIKLIVDTAKSAGCPVAAHATSKEGMRRATLGGVATIEHGDEGDIEVFRLMADRGVALCPTLAVGEAMRRYRGW